MFEHIYLYIFRFAVLFNYYPTVASTNSVMVAPKEPIEKPSGIQVEYPMVEDKNAGVEGDYSGAVKKTDPVEIKLVKKLDTRIMTILWAMYFLVSYLC